MSVYLVSATPDSIGVPHSEPWGANASLNKWRQAAWNPAGWTVGKGQTRPNSKIRAPKFVFQPREFCSLVSAGASTSQVMPRLPKLCRGIPGCTSTSRVMPRRLGFAFSFLHARIDLGGWGSTGPTDFKAGVDLSPARLTFPGSNQRIALQVF